MPLKINSSFALLDVKGGREQLKRRVENGEKIPITIHGDIVGVWSKDDGISIEFEVSVKGALEDIKP